MAAEATPTTRSVRSRSSAAATPTGADPAAQTPGAKGERFIFDITDIVSRLEAAGKWDEDRITVSFHPALPEGYRAKRTPSVRIGRVYLTHG
jgi:hypothetical protein